MLAAALAVPLIAAVLYAAGALDRFQGGLADKNAEARVRRDLALEQLADELGVQVSDAEFNQTLLNLAQSNGMNVQQLVQQLGQDGLHSYFISLQRERGLQQALAQLAGGTAEAQNGSAEAATTQATEAQSQAAEPSENAQNEGEQKSE